MNYADQRLEFQLRLLLDPIVQAPVPPRQRRRTLRDERRVLELPLMAPVVPDRVEAFA